MALVVDLAAATEGDLVHTLTLRAFEEYRGVLEPPAGVLSEPIEHAENAVRDGRAAIARIDLNPAGSVRWEAHGDRMYVGRLAVVPEYRRHGVAAALMDFAEDVALGTGFHSVQVMVREALPGNVAFFAGRGYAIVSTDPHPRKPLHLVHTLEKKV